MKKIKIGLIIIITAIISISSSIYAATIFFAKDIKFISKNDDFQSTNVEDALNEIYEKSENPNITTGESFLIIAGTSGYEISNNGNNFSGYLTLVNLDFSNILRFNYSYDLSTTNSIYQFARFYDSNKEYLKLSLTSSGTFEVNKMSDISFQVAVAYKNKGVFKVSSYTTTDGVEHTF